MAGRRARADRRRRLGSAAHGAGDHGGGHRAGGGGRPVRPAAVRQRVGRLRRVPGRHPRRPRPRAADRQRDQGPRASSTARARLRRETDAGQETLRAAAARGGRRQGGHQPAPLPDDEGPPGVEAGRDRARSTSTRRAGGQRLVRLHTSGRAGRRARRSSATAPTPPPPSSTCSTSSGCRDGPTQASRRCVVARARPRCDAGRWRPSREALTAGRQLAAATGGPLDALDDRRRRRPDRRRSSPLTAWRPCTRRTTTLLTDYGPETWGAVVAQAVGDARARPSCWPPGTDRGNEVLAHAAARLDLPMVANCTTVTPGEPMTVTSVRWGGSLLEEADPRRPDARCSPSPLHAFEASPAASPVDAGVERARRRARPGARPQRRARPGRAEAGITLATAPVVVGGGRGVGSAEAFAPARGAGRAARRRRRLLARR